MNDLFRLVSFVGLKQHLETKNCENSIFNEIYLYYFVSYTFHFNISGCNMYTIK